ncbi:hypothetical protein ES705_23096 [subsurface metagenome]
MKSFSIFKLYTVNEIAEITDFKVDKITLLLRKGTLKGRKVGRIWCSRGWEILWLISENRKLEELKIRFGRK